MDAAYTPFPRSLVRLEDGQYPKRSRVSPPAYDPQTGRLVGDEVQPSNFQIKPWQQQRLDKQIQSLKDQYRATKAQLYQQGQLLPNDANPELKQIAAAAAQLKQQPMTGRLTSPSFKEFTGVSPVPNWEVFGGREVGGRYPLIFEGVDLATAPGVVEAYTQDVKGRADFQEANKRKLAELRDKYQLAKNSGVSPEYLQAIVEKGKEVKAQIDWYENEQIALRQLGDRYTGRYYDKSFYTDEGGSPIEGRPRTIASPSAMRQSFGLPAQDLMQAKSTGDGIYGMEFDDPKKDAYKQVALIPGKRSLSGLLSDAEIQALRSKRMDVAQSVLPTPKQSLVTREDFFIPQQQQLQSSNDYQRSTVAGGQPIALSVGAEDMYRDIIRQNLLPGGMQVSSTVRDVMPDELSAMQSGRWFGYQPTGSLVNVDEKTGLPFDYYSGKAYGMNQGSNSVAADLGLDPTAESRTEAELKAIERASLNRSEVGDRSAFDFNLDQMAANDADRQELYFRGFSGVDRYNLEGDMNPDAPWSTSMGQQYRPVPFAERQIYGAPQLRSKLLGTGPQFDINSAPAILSNKTFLTDESGRIIPARQSFYKTSTGRRIPAITQNVFEAGTSPIALKALQNAGSITNSPNLSAYTYSDQVGYQLKEAAPFTAEAGRNIARALGREPVAVARPIGKPGVVLPNPPLPESRQFGPAQIGAAPFSPVGSFLLPSRKTEYPSTPLAVGKALRLFGDAGGQWSGQRLPDPSWRMEEVTEFIRPGPEDLSTPQTLAVNRPVGIDRDTTIPFRTNQDLKQFQTKQDLAYLLGQGYIQNSLDAKERLELGLLEGVGSRGTPVYGSRVWDPGVLGREQVRVPILQGFTGRGSMALADTAYDRASAAETYGPMSQPLDTPSREIVLTPGEERASKALDRMIAGRELLTGRIPMPSRSERTQLTPSGSALLVDYTGQYNTPSYSGLQRRDGSLATKIYPAAKGQLLDRETVSDKVLLANKDGEFDYYYKEGYPEGYQPLDPQELARRADKLQMQIVGQPITEAIQEVAARPARPSVSQIIAAKGYTPKLESPAKPSVEQIMADKESRIIAAKENFRSQYPALRLEKAMASSPAGKDLAAKYGSEALKALAAKAALRGARIAS